MKYGFDTDKTYVRVKFNDKTSEGKMRIGLDIFIVCLILAFIEGRVRFSSPVSIYVYARMLNMDWTLLNVDAIEVIVIT